MATTRCVAVVGFVLHDRDLYNAAAVCSDGAVRGVYRKCELPNYSVFDELRYFARGQQPDQLYRIGGVPISVIVLASEVPFSMPIAWLL